MDVYNAQKNPELASSIADQYPCANISKEEKENMFYSPAWNSYLDSNYAEAAPNFEIFRPNDSWCYFEMLTIKRLSFRSP
jgi:hypothetical protein